MSRKSKPELYPVPYDSPESSGSESEDLRKPVVETFRPEKTKTKSIQRPKVEKKLVVVESSSESEDSAPPPPKEAKPKRKMSQAQLDSLAKGREKARLRKQEINDEINRKKAEHKAMKEARYKEIEDYKQKKTEDLIVKKAIKIKKEIIKKKKALEVSSSESDSESEESVAPVPKSKPRPKKAVPKTEAPPPPPPPQTPRPTVMQRPTIVYM